MSDDKRLIEDYLPIEKISAEASREKSVRKGHISTLHLWWARRPLVACRAAVYGALVPASRFVPNGASDEKKQSLGRANAAKFMQRLCRYPSESKPEIALDIERAVIEAQRHILEAHAERLTRETGKNVTVEDIEEGRAPRPRVLDMFAGGGAIPLEALRLGCEAYALDLNPVAHIIELCTLVYPQKYGKPDPAARGMVGPTNAQGETTWGGLVGEVRYWGNYIRSQVKAEIGDLYPLIPDPDFKGKKIAVQADWLKGHAADELPPDYLKPVAYLWTRTVICKNPHCRATVPLAKQTWLCKKASRYIALKTIAPKGQKHVRFEVIEAHSENALGFDPEFGSKSGNATCPFCGTVADSDYVKIEGSAGRMATQLMAVACTRPGARGKVYLPAHDVSDVGPEGPSIERRIRNLCNQTGLTVPNEPLTTDGKNSVWCISYGIKTVKDLHTPRQLLALMTFAARVRESVKAIEGAGLDQQRALAIATYLATALDKVADLCTMNCPWEPVAQAARNMFNRQGIPLLWDFGENIPIGDGSGSFSEHLQRGLDSIEVALVSSRAASLARGSATECGDDAAVYDAIVTDPPYYDNVPYSNLADFFYAWLRRSVGQLYAQHFAGSATPKKTEIVADPCRHAGDRKRSRAAYEEMMARCWEAASKCLKPEGLIVCVYAHKTTAGWTTLVNSFRQAGFEIIEAWPLDTEMIQALKTDKAMLASSIFLVARKRDSASTGNYESEVRPELEQIVGERVRTLWDMGISGADLVIACVGAGLRAFTRFLRVEYGNGEEVPAERFLAEVETVVLEAILARLSKEVGSSSGRFNLAGLDAATRFYVLWRYTYQAADLDAGEAIVFANGTHVELDGPTGLSTGARALIEKKKGKYKLKDFTERGGNEKLGLAEDGQPAPLIDVLHRIMWLIERRPSGIPEFLREVRPNTEQLRLVAQALAGPALKGGELGEVATSTELAALTKLTANWRSVVEGAADAAVGPLFRTVRKDQ